MVTTQSINCNCKWEISTVSSPTIIDILVALEPLGFLNYIESKWQTQPERHFTTIVSGYGIVHIDIKLKKKNGSKKKINKKVNGKYKTTKI